VDEFQSEIVKILDDFKENNPDALEALITSNAIRRKEFR